MNATDNREWPARFCCNGPEGTFWTDDSTLANRLLAGELDRDDWTVTDTATFAAPPPPTTGDGGQRRATDAEIAEWLDRHDLRGALPGSDARCAFEDAQSLCASPASAPPAAKGEDADEQTFRRVAAVEALAASGWTWNGRFWDFPKSSPVGAQPEPGSVAEDAVERATKAISDALAGLDRDTPLDPDLYGDRYSSGPHSRLDLTRAEDAFVRACSPANIRALLTTAGTPPAVRVNPEAVRWEYRHARDGRTWGRWKEAANETEARTHEKNLHAIGHRAQVRALGVIEPVGEELS